MQDIVIEFPKKQNKKCSGLWRRASQVEDLLAEHIDELFWLPEIHPHANNQSENTPGSSEKPRSSESNT